MPVLDVSNPLHLFALGSGFLIMGTLSMCALGPEPARFEAWEHVEARVIETDLNLVGGSTCKTVQRSYEYDRDGTQQSARGPYIQIGFASQSMCFEGPDDGATVTVAVDPDHPASVRSQLDEDQLRRSGWSTVVFCSPFVFVGVVFTAGGLRMCWLRARA
jgi:hypothetical protein